jgi:hypothetical protein
MQDKNWPKYYGNHNSYSLCHSVQNYPVVHLIFTVMFLSQIIFKKLLYLNPLIHSKKMSLHIVQIHRQRHLMSCPLYCMTPQYTCTLQTSST